MYDIKGKVKIHFTEEEYTTLTTSNTFINHEVDNLLKYIIIGC